MSGFDIVDVDPSPADDWVISDGTSSVTWDILPDCADGDGLFWDSESDSWTCEALVDFSGGGGCPENNMQFDGTWPMLLVVAVLIGIVVGWVGKSNG